MELMTTEILIAGLIAIFLIKLYNWSTFTYDHWKNLGVPGPRPIPLVGNFGSVIINQQSKLEKQRELYNKWKHEPFVGYFHARTPMLLINDLDFIKNVLVADFHKFPGRGIIVDEKEQPLEDHLFNLQGHRWKVLRAKLSPAFTSGKLKQMVELIIECSEQLEKYIWMKIKEDNVIECTELAAKYTTDVIGSCIFGINMAALERDDSVFRILGKKSFELNLFHLIQKVIHYVAPGLYELPSTLNVSRDHSQFFINFVNQAIEYREKNDIVRHDLIDILKDIKKNKGDIDFELTESLLAAQAFVFFVAGFETSSKTISFALYELAIVPEIQEKLRTEIMNTLKKHNGQLSYDAINEMKYLDMVVKETLRKNPPAFELNRKNIAPYKIPGHDVILPTGSIIDIPVYCIQHDEFYYPNPELFDPQRFSEENNNRHPMMYLPFGAGPKKCIGARFATYQSKLGIITVIKNFKITPSEMTQIPYKIDKSKLVLSAENGIHLKFELVI